MNDLALPSRRVILAAATASLILPRFAFARNANAFVIDWQGAVPVPEVAACLEQQIGLVEALPIKPEAAAFFAAQVITVDKTDDTKTRAGPRGVFFERKSIKPDNPVLLHELLHRYHFLKLPGAFGNEQVRGYLAAARAAGDFPRQAYLYTNPLEFYAMVASVTLYGKAARPPFTRARVAAAYPAIDRKSVV